ncbi:uncharacterized protein VP01_6297g1 [Puccinia sorghi]|uniref:Uncharacterized protein n=1 Tax=Puccinia sorghi TaxID=27349 RepID=A0A0L6UIF9_9BASI|nr:uncharacterized protein VP01_6297g1 [Puccinia sorghi]
MTEMRKDDRDKIKQTSYPPHNSQKRTLEKQISKKKEEREMTKVDSTTGPSTGSRARSRRSLLTVLEVRTPEAGQVQTRQFESFVDNHSVIALVTNPIFQQRSKHIDIINHWLRETHDTGLIQINYIPTGSMLADVCNKSLGKSKHQSIIANLKIGWQ